MPHEPARSMVRTACRALVLLALAAACAAPAPESPPPAGTPADVPPPAATPAVPAAGGPVTLTVDRDRYAAGAPVALRLANAGDATWGYGPCTRTVEREQGGAWVVVPEPDRMCTMELRLLAARETATAATALPSPLPAGRYRLTLAISRQAESGDGAQVTVASPAFRVE